MSERISRRNFLKAAATGAASVFGGAGAALLSDAHGCRKHRTTSKRKLIVVLFGGGTRCSESIDDPQHRYIPNLWNKLAPSGTLMTNMRVEHKVVHPNSAGSIMTGHWEWDDLDWSMPVKNPTIFEIFRKAKDAPDSSTWAFVYASILAQTGRSLAKDFGSRYGANIVMPPTIPRATAEVMAEKMHLAAASGSVEEELDAAEKCAALAKGTSRISYENIKSLQGREFARQQYEQWKGNDEGTSHDAFLANRAINCMKEFSPDVMTVCFGEIDCAHYGSWSRYVEAIKRTDELTWRLWQSAQQLGEYRDNTLMLVLPDHGREFDRDGYSGFIHHSDFYTNSGVDEGCRRVWMLAVGPGVQGGKQIDTPTPITTAAATGLEYLGLEASKGAEKSILNLIA